MKVKLIAREQIQGIIGDEDIYLLDGIKTIECDVDSNEEIVDLFEKEFPDFNADGFKIIPK